MAVLMVKGIERAGSMTGDGTGLNDPIVGGEAGEANVWGTAVGRGRDGVNALESRDLVAATR